MIEIVISYFYILVFCGITGWIVSDLMSVIIGKTIKGFSSLSCGIVSITVLVGYLSIFMKIGLGATMLILLVGIVYIFFFGKRINGCLCRSSRYYFIL